LGIWFGFLALDKRFLVEVCKILSLASVHCLLFSFCFSFCSYHFFSNGLDLLVEEIVIFVWSWFVDLCDCHYCGCRFVQLLFYQIIFVNCQVNPIDHTRPHPKWRTDEKKSPKIPFGKIIQCTRPRCENSHKTNRIKQIFATMFEGKYEQKYWISYQTFGNSTCERFPRQSNRENGKWMWKIQRGCDRNANQIVLIDMWELNLSICISSFFFGIRIRKQVALVKYSPISAAQPSTFSRFTCDRWWSRVRRRVDGSCIYGNEWMLLPL